MQYLKDNYIKNIQHETLLKITAVALLPYDFFYFLPTYIQTSRPNTAKDVRMKSAK